MVVMKGGTFITTCFTCKLSITHAAARLVTKPLRFHKSCIKLTLNMRGNNAKNNVPAPIPRRFARRGRRFPARRRVSRARKAAEWALERYF